MLALLTDIGPDPVIVLATTPMKNGHWQSPYTEGAAMVHRPIVEEQRT